MLEYKISLLRNNPLEMTSKRIKIYNDVDSTCYDISYYRHNPNDITIDEITKRILQDVITISQENNTLRYTDLSFHNLKFEANKDYSVMRFYTQNVKCNGHLHKACTYCLPI